MVATPKKKAEVAPSESDVDDDALQPVNPDLWPDVSSLVTEDDTPVDNFPSAKQQRLLVGSLYSGLVERSFLAEANVGIYSSPNQPPIVLDVLVSFDVSLPSDWWEKENRCYFLWMFDKAPDMVLEIVSNKKGEELGRKKARYARMRISYYAVYDPVLHLSEQPLHVFELRGNGYTELADGWMSCIQLGLTLWQGAFEGSEANWLRWCDQSGNLIKTGDEQASIEKQRAETEKQRAEKLAQLLREQGIDPDAI